MTSNYNHTIDWFYEGNVSRNLVNYLKKSGYTILKDNSDNCNARGEDILAVATDGTTEIIEVKGYPTQFHTKGKLKGKCKNTHPAQQAKHWFSEVIFSNIYRYKKYKEFNKIQLSIAFPLKDKYLKLVEDVEDYFTDFNLNVKVYFVNEIGEISTRNLNTDYNT